MLQKNLWRRILSSECPFILLYGSLDSNIKIQDATPLIRATLLIRDGVLSDEKIVGCSLYLLCPVDAPHPTIYRIFRDSLF